MGIYNLLWDLDCELINMPMRHNEERNRNFGYNSLIEYNGDITKNLERSANIMATRGVDAIEIVS